MPTPSESTDALPLERERSIHITCPPEEDRPGQWSVEVLDQLGRAATDSTNENGAAQRSEEQSREAGIPSSPDPGTDHQEPTMGESLPGSLMDDKTVERIPHDGPTLSTIDLRYPTNYGTDSTRVCLSKHLTSTGINLIF